MATQKRQSRCFSPTKTSTTTSATSISQPSSVSDTTAGNPTTTMVMTPIRTRARTSTATLHRSSRCTTCPGCCRRVSGSRSPTASPVSRAQPPEVEEQQDPNGAKKDAAPATRENTKSNRIVFEFRSSRDDGKERIENYIRKAYNAYTDEIERMPAETSPVTSTSQAWHSRSARTIPRRSLRCPSTSATS